MLRRASMTSALHRRADFFSFRWHVSKVPETDSCAAASSSLNYDKSCLISLGETEQKRRPRRVCLAPIVDKRCTRWNINFKTDAIINRCTRHMLLRPLVK